MTKLWIIHSLPCSGKSIYAKQLTFDGADGKQEKLRINHV
jgi:hypothetical protein